MRAAESPARALLPSFGCDERAGNLTVRHVVRWLPVHDLTTAQVWDEISQPGPGRTGSTPTCRGSAAGSASWQERQPWSAPRSSIPKAPPTEPGSSSGSGTSSAVTCP